MPNDDAPFDPYLPLTAAQRGMWFSQRLAGPEAIFNLAEVLTIDGPLETAAFYEAITQAERETEAVHVQFIERDGHPRQVERGGITGVFPLIDLSGRADPWSHFLAWARDEFSAPHRPESDLLYASGLVKASATRHYWYHRAHHVLLDGFSGGLMARRVAEIYAARVQGQPVTPCRFGSLAALLEEERAYLASPAKASDRAYWTELLAEPPSPVSLAQHRPVSLGRPLRQSCRPPDTLIAAARATAQALGSSFPQLMIAAICVYMHRMTGATDLVLGMPVTARSNKRLRQIPSMLANAVPLRVRLRPEMRFADVLTQVGKRVREALRHQGYRYEELRRDLDLQADGRHLFSTVVNIEPFDYDLRFGDAVATPLNLTNGSVEDLAVFVYDRGVDKGVWIDFDANAALYSQADLAGHQARLLRLLHAIVDDPTRLVGLVDLLSPQERRQLLHLNPAPRVIAEPMLAELFERQAAATPYAVAAVFEEQALLYTSLNAQANRLARELIARGVGPEQIVAIALPRSAALLVSLLAVAKAGAAYLPIDVELPAERIASMFDDAAPCLVLTDEETLARLPASYPTMRVDDPAIGRHRPANPSDQERVRPLRPDHVAYLIYTSGSTGRPKGVAVTHAGLRNFLAAMQSVVSLEPTDRLLAVTSVSFDIAALELYLPLLSGARVVIAPSRVNRHPAALGRLMVTTGTSVMQATPSLWETLLGEDAEVLRGLRILVGGEALPAPLARALRDKAWDVINLYGPTETTVWSTSLRMPGCQRAPAHVEARSQTPADVEPSIGRPIFNTRVYVLDCGLQPTPVGVTGELCIAGDGLARGYMKRPGITAERFVADPFGPPGHRMYRTGDLARWRADHGIDFLGRSDQQVKIRGFRIELGEIEAALAAHPDIAQAAVIVREDRPGDKRLAAYVVPRAAATPEATELRRFIAGKLPDYMLPTSITTLPALPLLVSGKLDRKSLPAPGHEQAASRRGPRDATEEILCGLIADTLGLPDMNIDSNFFELGGDSLKMARIVSQVRDTFGIELPLSAVFESANIASLADVVRRDASARAPLQRRPRPPRVPLSPAQRQLWFANQREESGGVCNIALSLRLSGRVDAAALEAAIADVTHRHESLRTVFPEEGTSPCQRVLPVDRAPFRLALAETDEAALPRQVATAAAARFDLARETPLRATLFRLAPDEAVLHVVAHPIAADEPSLRPLAHDLALAYAARRADSAPDQPPLPIQYADYTLWQHALLGGERQADSPIAHQVDFWRRRLAGSPATIDLPLDFAPPPVVGYAGDAVPLRIDAATHDRLLALASKTRSSLFMVLQAAFATLLTRMGAGTDIPLGTPVTGRGEPLLDGLVGHFVNTLVLRTDTSGNPTFESLVERVRAASLEAHANQDVPFERLVELLDPPRVPGRHPLFQVMLALQDAAQDGMSLDGGVQATPWPSPVAVSRFDLSLLAEERRQQDGTPLGIDAVLEFRTDLFEHATIVALGARLAALLQALGETPSLRVDEVDVLLPEEHEEFGRQWCAA